MRKLEEVKMGPGIGTAWAATLFAGRGWPGRGEEGMLKPLGGEAGGVGELELGLEMKGFANGVESGTKRRATKPTTKNARGGPMVGRRAEWVLEKRAKKNGLTIGGTENARHDVAPFE